MGDEVYVTVGMTRQGSFRAQKPKWQKFVLFVQTFSGKDYVTMS